MKKLNKKGFTLVELLAVIVVLAIIMIIAVPAVIQSMDTAKKNSLVIEARKAINVAMQKVQTDTLTGTELKTCYTLSDLKIDGGGKYYGKVVIDGTDYKVSIWDGSYAISEKKSDELNAETEGEGAGMTAATTKPSGVDTCA